MKSIKKISLVIIAVFALYACNSDFDEDQVNQIKNNNIQEQDLSIDDNYERAKSNSNNINIE